MNEQYEWIYSWSEETQKKDLPRVLLIGDSITYSYQEKVRELLKGKYYVDYLATSYAIDSPFYQALVQGFFNDNDYSVIHFNHGLHGKHIEKPEYQERVEKLLNTFTAKDIKIILALTTKVNLEGNKELDQSWDVRVQERNQSLLELANKYGFKVDDLYSLSLQIPNEMRDEDGTHYYPEGAGMLASAVAKIIEE